VADRDGGTPTLAYGQGRAAGDGQRDTGVTSLAGAPLARDSRLSAYLAPRVLPSL